MKKEIFKPIRNYEDSYQVSNLGRVRRVTKNSSKSDTTLKLRISASGYLSATLFKDSKAKLMPVHRLMFDAFVGINKNNVVAFKDGDKTNVTLDNLYQASRAEVAKINTEARQEARKIKRSGLTKGIIYDTTRKKWSVTSHLDGVEKHLGFFDREVDAHAKLKHYEYLQHELF